MAVGIPLRSLGKLLHCRIEVPIATFEQHYGHAALRGL